MTEQAEERAWRQPIRTIGVIGLHGMGRALCHRLSAEGRQFGIEKVAAFDQDASALAGLNEAEVVPCSSIAHLVDTVDLLQLCLPAPGDVGRIARSHEGLLDCVRQGQIIVDHGWSSLDLTRQLTTAFNGRGAAFLDAPIGRSGSVDGAIDAGCLAFAIGGDTAAIDAALPRLRCFASGITRVGQSGAAQVVRQMGDLVTLQTFTALAEALITASAFGIQGDKLFDALAKGDGENAHIGRHGLAEFLGADEAKADQRTPIADAERRMKEATELAKGKNLSLMGAGGTLTLLKRAVENGLGEKDLSGLLNVMQPAAKRSPQDMRRA